tara:strand:- start:582 stop:968 length:387 start_codon:yes stop_codon:yes gene_type:complete
LILFTQTWWYIAAPFRRFVVAVVSALSLIFAPALYAAEEYTHSVTLSSSSGSAMAQALVDEALRANPGITALEAAVRSAEARIVQSTALRDPQHGYSTHQCQAIRLIFSYSIGCVIVLHILAYSLFRR